MDMFYCLIDAKEAKDNPSSLGWRYCKEHEDDWVPGNVETERYNTIGFVLGCDFVVKDNKAYSLHKAFQDLDNKRTILLCKESVMGCDVID